jgi:hypothetical protein
MNTMPTEIPMNNQETLNFQLSLLKMMTRLDNLRIPEPAGQTGAHPEQAMEALVARVSAADRDPR